MKQCQRWGATVDKEDLLILIQGLSDYADPEQHHPVYPPKLRMAMNRLSLHMMGDYPTTVSGLFALFEKPLQEWWLGDVPEGIDEHAPLWTGTRPSDEAQAFLAGQE